MDVVHEMQYTMLNVFDEMFSVWVLRVKQAVRKVSNSKFLNNGQLATERLFPR